MTVRRFTHTITVDASGDADVDTAWIRGNLISIRYVKDDFADGVDFTLTGKDTGQTLWAETSVNASASKYPRAPTHTTAGAAALYAGGGTAVNALIALDEQINIVVADGGNATSGTLHIIVDG